MKKEQTVAEAATIDLNDVTAFARVVETGSFTGAAKKLGLPKSAVSRRVSRLEGALGVRLLRRTTRQLALTDAGTRYHQSAIAALAGLSEAAAVVSSLQEEPQGLVRFTAPPEMPAVVSEAMTVFIRKYPRVRIELDLTSRIVDLVAEGFDFALRAGVLRNSSLIARKIHTAAFVLVAAPSYLKLRPAPKTDADLDAHDCVLFRPQNGKSRWTLTGPEGERAVYVTGPTGTDDLNFVRDLALAGAGIALIPLQSCGEDLHKKRLVRILPDYRGMMSSFYLVYPAGRHVPQRVSLFRDHMYEALKKAFSKTCG